MEGRGDATMKKTILRRTLETVLAPLEHGFADAWRDAVNQELRHWVERDASFFRVSDGSPTRIDPTSTRLVEARNAYREQGCRSLDPWAVQRTRPGEVVLADFTRLMGRERYLRSRYYREFLRPRGITDYVGLQVGADRGEHVVLSCFNFGDTDDEEAIARAIRRFRALVPALKPAVAVWMAARTRFEEFGSMVDEVPEALLLCDDEGRTVHANSALVQLLDSEPDASRLRGELSAVARELARARSGDIDDLVRSARERKVRTERRFYRVRPVTGDGFVRGERPGGVVLMVRPFGSGGRAGDGPGSTDRPEASSVEESHA